MTNSLVSQPKLQKVQCTIAFEVDSYPGHIYPLFGSNPVVSPRLYVGRRFRCDREMDIFHVHYNSIRDSQGIRCLRTGKMKRDCEDIFHTSASISSMHLYVGRSFWVKSCCLSTLVCWKKISL
ncbi:unnamed protein product [Musa textilis]